MGDLSPSRPPTVPEPARGETSGVANPAGHPDPRRAVVDAVGTLERTGLRGWPGTSTRDTAQHRQRRSPGFIPIARRDGVVDLQVFASAAERDAAMRAGVRRLVRSAAGRR